MSTATAFRVYRYQLLPLDRNDTKDLYHDRAPEEIIANKNAYFAEAIATLSNIRHRDAAIISEVQSLTTDVFSIHLAPSRPLTRETPDFRQEKVENWPHITVYILNDKDEQYILIQDRVIAFANTDTVAKLIERGTRNKLERLGLSLHVERLFDKGYFWGLVETYKNRVTEVEFEFITPNMSNISHTLANTLKSLGKETNAVREDLALASDPASSLDINPSNETIQGLVDYTSEGGGDITLKIKGIRKKFHTSKSSKEVHLTGLEITAPPEQVAQILREALR